MERYNFKSIIYYIRVQQVILHFYENFVTKFVHDHIIDICQRLTEFIIWKG